MAEIEPDGQAGQDEKLPFWQSPAARLVVGMVVGLVVATAMGIGYERDWLLSALAGWAAVAVTFTGWTWSALWCCTATATKSHAEKEPPQHWIVLLFILTGAAASVAAIVVLLERSNSPDSDLPHGPGAGWLALGTVVLSWFTIHTLYALIYAKSYFDPLDGGGIEFNRPGGLKDHPRYSDFFYIAFTVGVSFAVSDTNLTSYRMRRIALGHGLLSFLFGSIIVASVVNLISSVA
jgi:uncharacterized membrane protein